MKYHILIGVIVDYDKDSCAKGLAACDLTRADRDQCHFLLPEVFKSFKRTNDRLPPNCYLAEFCEDCERLYAKI